MIKKPTPPTKKFSAKKLVFGIIAILLVGISAFLIWNFAIKERLKAIDCTKYEKYDSFRGECYFDCETDQECNEIQAKVDAELDKFFEGSSAKIDTSPPTTIATPVEVPTESTESKDTPTKEETGSETGGKIYRIKNRKISPSPDQTANYLWTLFSKVALPSEIDTYFDTFEVFNDKNNDTMASVWPSNTKPKWHININEAYASDRKDLIHTIVHEYGHVLTLNNKQVSEVNGACPRLSLSEGCSYDDSFINAFNDQFWKDYGEAIPSDDGANQDEVAEFYQSNPTAFVSEYAATNISEDITESWAIFVLREKPTGKDQKTAKVNFFYNYPELVKRRDEIRRALISEIE